MILRDWCIIIGNKFFNMMSMIDLTIILYINCVKFRWILMKNYMHSQKKRIELDKWIEGCRIKKDPGSSFILNWIKDNAQQFRYDWERSLCCECDNSDDCGHNVVQNCGYFTSNK